MTAVRRVWVVGAVVLVVFGLCGASSTGAATVVLTPVPGSPFIVGRNPGPVAFDFSRGLLAVGNEGDGTVSVFSVNSSTGALAPVPGSPSATGTQPSGVGSVSLAFSLSAGLLAVTDAGGVTGGSVAVFSVGSSGALTPVTGSPFAIAYPSDQNAHPLSAAFSVSGDVLAITNLFAGVSVFSVSSSTGALSPAPGWSPTAVGGGEFAGEFPESAAFSPSGRLLAVTNASADTVSVSSISYRNAAAPLVQITSPSQGDVVGNRGRPTLGNHAGSPRAERLQQLTDHDRLGEHPRQLDPIPQRKHPDLV